MDRNPKRFRDTLEHLRSLSARRAWIEIDIDDKFGGLLSVALRKESVDRNTLIFYLVLCHMVALRKESVDRNGYYSNTTSQHIVALRKESVDRNYIFPSGTFTGPRGRSPQGERG